ncbi:MAG: ParB/RepB/Spo0J family partition protein [Bdellovibrionales bacterium]
MSNNQPQKPQGPPKGKGLGRGLGSLLGSSNEGAFSKTTASGGGKGVDLVGVVIPQKPEASMRAASENPALDPTTAPALGVTQAPPLISAPAPGPAALEAAPSTTPLSTPTPTPPPAAAPAPAPAAPSVPAHMRLWHLPIEKVRPNPSQPRQIFEKEALQELANSIREKGIIQPLLVRKRDGEGFEIIAGERRWRAAQLAGLKEVPALIKESEEREVLELALIENIQRENLNALEEAEAYEFLIKKYNLTQQELAQKVGKDRATVANMLRILQLQPGVRQMVSKGELSLGQAKVLLSVSEGRLQEDLAIKARNESLSVRALEKLIAKARNPLSSTSAPVEDPRVQAARALGEELQKLIGSKVVLDYDKGKGRIVIHFYSDLELNQIADTLRDSWRN